MFEFSDFFLKTHAVGIQQVSTVTLYKRSYWEEEPLFFTTELSPHRSRDLNFSAVHTNAKPKLGAEQMRANSHWTGKTIPCFGKDSLSPFTFLLCGLYICF